MSSVLLNYLKSFVMKTALVTIEGTEVAKLTRDFKTSLPSLLVFGATHRKRVDLAVKRFKFLIQFCFIHTYNVTQKRTKSKKNFQLFYCTKQLQKTLLFT